MFKDMTPEERSAAAQKAAATRKANKEQTTGAAEMGERPGGALLTPVYTLKLVRETTVPAYSDSLRGASEAARILSAYIADQPQEHFVVMLLNIKSKIIGLNTVNVGTIDTTLVRICEVFRPAILGNAHSIIVAHNHPSGDPTPSPEDARLTREIVKAGKILDIEVVDHIVIGANGSYVSLRDRCIGFDQ